MTSQTERRNICPRCGETLYIYVSAHLGGTCFSPDGFALDDLELGANDATVYCAGATCAYKVPFGTWQADSVRARNRASRRRGRA